MSENNHDFNPFDPTGLFKELRNSGMDAWSKAMLQMINSDGYARATCVALDAWLSTSKPFREATEKAMSQALAAWNLPSRNDVTRLAERLTNIEMRLDDLEAKLDEAAARA